MLSTRKPRSRITIKQTERDRKYGEKRLSAIGELKYKKMVNFLDENMGKYFKRYIILNIADETAKEFKLKVDRVARRKKGILYCWLVENWETIGTTFLQKVEVFLIKNGVPVKERLTLALDIGKNEFSSENHEAPAESTVTEQPEYSFQEQEEEQFLYFDDFSDQIF